VCVVCVNITTHAHARTHTHTHIHIHIHTHTHTHTHTHKMQDFFSWTSVGAFRRACVWALVYVLLRL
jgi:hypothetical protein